MKFIGIDLAWKMKPKPKKERTAIAVLDDNARMEWYTKCTTDEEILKAIDTLAVGECILGIDAPLVIPDGTHGRRDCEAYSKLKLHVYPTDPHRFEKWYGGCRGEELTKKLEKKGYRLMVNPPNSPDKVVVEVYPTGSWKRLFTEFRKFKGVRVEEKHKALLMARYLLIRGMSPTYPPVQNMDLINEELGCLHELHGHRLDMYGDALDAVMSAYTLFLWIMNQKLCKVEGDLKSGFILLPVRPQDEKV